MQRAAVARSPLGGNPRVQKSSFDDLDIVGSTLKVDVKLLYTKYQALIVDTIVARAFKLVNPTLWLYCPNQLLIISVARQRRSLHLRLIITTKIAEDTVLIRTDVSSIYQ
jgi:hypothetical protein